MAPAVTPPPRAPRTRTLNRPAAVWGALAFVAVVATAVLVDGHLAHGVDATWRAEVDGEWRVVDHTVEHRAQFPNERRALSRYIQGWNFERDGIPAQLFPFRAQLRTTLTVPRSGYRLAVRGSNRVRVTLDGETLRSERTLEVGDHRLVVDWSGDFQRSGIRLGWELCRGESCDEVPAKLFAPDTRWPKSRVWLWVLMMLAALGLGAAFYRARAASLKGRVRILGGIALAGILVLGLGFRLYDYDVMPDFRENGDELFATWNGWQLLESGETRGWSLWAPIYGGRVHHERLQYFGLDWAIIQPYFEHPPLTHVLVGAAAHLGGAEHYAHSKLKHTRLVPVLLCIPTLLLLFLVGRRVDPHGPAPWFGALLYAILPTIVLQTRVIKEEALLGTLSLGAVWCFLRWREHGKTRALVMCGVLAGMCALAKVTGAAYVLAVIMLALALPREERLRATLIVATAGIATGGLFLLFGAVIDWSTFVYATEKQGTRPLHFNIFMRWFDVTLINHSVIGRGWILFLWLGTTAAHVGRSWKRSSYVAIPLLTYLGAITIGTGNWTFGWYIVPLYPWLCLGCGRFLAEAWRRPDLFKGTLIGVVLVLYTMNFAVEPAWMKQPNNWGELRWIVTGLTALLLAPWGLVQVWPTHGFQRFARGAMVCSLVLVTVICGRFVMNYETNYDLYRDFDRDVYFDR